MKCELCGGTGILKTWESDIDCTWCAPRLEVIEELWGIKTRLEAMIRMATGSGCMVWPHKRNILLYILDGKTEE